MNKEQTKEAIAVMQAFVDRKAIEFSVDNEKTWEVFAGDSPAWDWWASSYRIKPEILRYRRVIKKWSDGMGYYVDICVEQSSTKDTEEAINFVRWIDTEWIEEIV